MQHLVIRAARPAHLITNDWRTNGVGRLGNKQMLLFSWGLETAAWLKWTRLSSPLDLSLSHFLAVSHSYGYGLLDASAMVALAQNWTSVGLQHKCVIDMLTEPRYKRSKKCAHRASCLRRLDACICDSRNPGNYNSLVFFFSVTDPAFNIVRNRWLLHAHYSWQMDRHFRRRRMKMMMIMILLRLYLIEF